VDSLTVIIPTFNRRGVLKKALEGYLAQTAAQSIRELIVIDDGSTDETALMVREIAAGSPFEIRYLRQENKGPAAARNHGIREAVSDIILFTDDDIVPSRRLVAEHLAWHTRNPDHNIAVLGYVTWAPEVKATPFMMWYGADGQLFSYAHFAGHKQLEFTDFYSCNVSLKREFIRSNGGFDEDFKIAAYEDTELAFRLQKARMQLLYNPEASAYHMQKVSFESACRRVWKTDTAEEIFRRKEAGKYYYSKQGHNPQDRTRVPARIKRGSVQLAGFVLSPFKRIMDGRIRLPWSVYRIVFRLFCSYQRHEGLAKRPGNGEWI
jgi:glycosyltransferase involved in cell wall biosynthesis